MESEADSSGTQNTVYSTKCITQCVTAVLRVAEYKTLYSTNCILESVTAVLRLVEHKTLCIVQTTYWNASQQC